MTPPPPPEPTFEERLADLAAFDPNGCRAETPGFEALGGWLKNDGRELGASRVWIGDFGPLDANLEVNERATHGAGVWATFIGCAVRSSEAQYFDHDADDDNTLGTYYQVLTEHGEDLINSESQAPDYKDVPFPEPAEWIDGWNRVGHLGRWHDGTHDGQRVLIVQGAGNDNRLRTGSLQTPQLQLALQHTDIVLWILVGGYVGEGDNRAPAADQETIEGLFGSSLCAEAAPLCLFAPWEAKGRDDAGIKTGTSNATPQVAAALDTVRRSGRTWISST